MNNCLLIGFKNSGKTSVGRVLADRLNLLFVDTDEILIQQYAEKTGRNLTLREIYRLEGESRFRGLEREAILNLKLSQPFVMATGGGVLLDSEQAFFLKKKGRLVYLKTSIETLRQRLQYPEHAFFLDIKRENQYEHWADWIMDTEHRSVENIAHEIMLKMRGQDGQ